ncbi:MAG: cation transporter [Rhodocyclales bacterium GT-UBC]|nr:MAG: cation transporter [Rhodocyclales bacterium GT-UBC]
MSKSHTHGIPSADNERALRFALALTGCFLIAEVIGGVLTGSLALISDAAHMLTDTAALAIALAAIRVARRPADRRRTYGYHRFEILAAAFNALLLFAVALYILVEAYQRLTSPPEIQSVGMLVIASIGLVVNLISIRLLREGQSDSLNVKGAYLEVWSDLLGSIGVIVGAVVIQLTGWSWVDPLVAVAIGLWVLPRTWILLKDSLNILLEGVPEGIDLGEVEQAMLAVPGVLGVHDLHLWALTTGKSSLTAHVVYDQIYSPEKDLMPALQTVLANRFKVVHTTLQCEIEPCEHQQEGCSYVVSTPVRNDN